ncbi:UDP-Glycosyltransferase superfamily protein [Euphorbia peplus]|nr:UDP-Glycosyltransferase superfamily protein [Euphorbia peplus]
MTSRRRSNGQLDQQMLNISNEKIIKREDNCFKWLDKQEPNLVIYVSFGTTASLSDEQIRELASGLEASKVKFIWVLREADRGDIFTGTERRHELPEGFEERVEGMGMLTREWAPQIDILRHPPTGEFLSHC